LESRKQKADIISVFSFLFSAFVLRLSQTLNYPVGWRRHPFTEGECADVERYYHKTRRNPYHLAQNSIKNACFLSK
jgi:hypothetical protein